MKTFRDLLISLNGHRIDDLVDRLTSECRVPWRRAIGKEETRTRPESGSFCFERDADEGLPAAALFLFNKEGDVWYVSNIIPTKVGELSHDQYNNILLEFEKNVVRHAVSGTKIESHVTEDHTSISDVAGEDVANALIKFSNLANKSTGSSHPLDRKRWFEFLVLANKRGTDLYPDLVIQTLIDLGWSEERAYELGIEFEFAQDLLSHFRGN